MKVLLKTDDTSSGLERWTAEEGRPSMATSVGFPAKDLKQGNPASWRQLASETRCSRCEGLMVAEQYLDLRDDTGHLDFWARRCVQCGEVIDPVILQNRQRQLPLGRGAEHYSSGFSQSKEGS